MALKLTFIIQQVLDGIVPRQILNLEVSEEWISPAYEEACQALVDRAFAAADEICDTLEDESNELGVLEDEGLAGRIRYLTAVAIMAAVLDEQRKGELTDRLTYLRTAHAVANLWRLDTTYDLSNAAASLAFIGYREPADTLGTWIWLNLFPSDAGVHLRWVASTMWFKDAFGEEALNAVGPILREVEELLSTVQTEQDRSTRSHTTDILPAYSRAAAKQIAEAYIVDNPDRIRGAAVSAVYSLEEIPFRKPRLYGVQLEGCWIAYVRHSKAELRSSQIVAVSKTTGMVVYAGSADDEG